MKLTLRYFASVREAIGAQAETCERPGATCTVQDVLDQLCQNSPAHARAFADKAALRCAINMETAAFTDMVKDGDELALFPPMTGGAPDIVSVQSGPINVAKELDVMHALPVGAVVSFTGLVREKDKDGDAPLTTLTLEHYPGMTEQALTTIAADAATRWDLAGVRIIHRYGAMHPGEIIVLVIAASDHRTEAFEAAQFMMDALKTDAPFWKREDRGGKQTWVKAKQADDHARKMWD